MQEGGDSAEKMKERIISQLSHHQAGHARLFRKEGCVILRSYGSFSIRRDLSFYKVVLLEGFLSVPISQARQEQGSYI